MVKQLYRTNRRSQDPDNIDTFIREEPDISLALGVFDVGGMCLSLQTFPRTFLPKAFVSCDYTCGTAQHGTARHEKASNSRSTG